MNQLSDISKKESYVPPLSQKVLTADDKLTFFNVFPEWSLRKDADGHKLVRSYIFKSFMDGLLFLNMVALLAESGHCCPDIAISGSHVTVTWKAGNRAEIDAETLSLAKQTEHMYDADRY